MSHSQNVWRYYHLLLYDSLWPLLRHLLPTASCLLTWLDPQWLLLLYYLSTSILSITLVIVACHSRPHPAPRDRIILIALLMILMIVMRLWWVTNMLWVCIGLLHECRTDWLMLVDIGDAWAFLVVLATVVLVIVVAVFEEDELLGEVWCHGGGYSAIEWTIATWCLPWTATEELDHREVLVCVEDLWIGSTAWLDVVYVVGVRSGFRLDFAFSEVVSDCAGCLIWCWSETTISHSGCLIDDRFLFQVCVHHLAWLCDVSGVWIQGWVDHRSLDTVTFLSPILLITHVLSRVLGRARHERLHLSICPKSCLISRA